MYTFICTGIYAPPHYETMSCVSPKNPKTMADAGTMCLLLTSSRFNINMITGILRMLSQTMQIHVHVFLVHELKLSHQLRGHHATKRTFWCTRGTDDRQTWTAACILIMKHGPQELFTSNFCRTFMQIWPVDSQISEFLNQHTHIARSEVSPARSYCLSSWSDCFKIPGHNLGT